MNVFLAGGTGMLGREVVRELVAGGHTVRALSRRPRSFPGCELCVGDLLDSESLAGACDGVDAVVSCAGASMKLGNWLDRRSFDEVDRKGNANLLREAESAGVRKFLYVSLYGADRLLHTEYAAAHEAFIAQL